MSEPASKWWAVQVRTGREHTAAIHLRLRGYEVFLPCYRERRRWSDRVKELQLPLFAGYLFCNVVGTRMDNIVGAPAVIRIVGNGCGPLQIPVSEIDAVRRIVDMQLAASPWPFIRVGRTVRVEAGPLRDLTGIVIGTKGDRRLIVSISLLQRSVAVELNADSVSIPVSVLASEAAEISRHHPAADKACLRERRVETGVLGGER